MPCYIKHKPIHSARLPSYPTFPPQAVMSKPIGSCCESSSDRSGGCKCWSSLGIPSPPGAMPVSTRKQNDAVPVLTVLDPGDPSAFMYTLGANTINSSTVYTSAADFVIRDVPNQSALDVVFLIRYLCHPEIFESGVVEHGGEVSSEDNFGFKIHKVDEGAYREYLFTNLLCRAEKIEGRSLFEIVPLCNPAYCNIINMIPATNYLPRLSSFDNPLYLANTHEHDVIAVYGEGETTGFVYSTGIAGKEFIVRDCPQEKTMEAVSMINYLAGRTVKDGETAGNSEGRHASTATHWFEVHEIKDDDARKSLLKNKMCMVENDVGKTIFDLKLHVRCDCCIKREDEIAAFMEMMGMWH